MDLDFDKYCVVDTSPTTVLIQSPRHRSNVSDRKSCGKPVCRNQCKDFRFSAEANEPLAFQSFKEVSSLGREKIDFTGRTQSAFSLGMIDSLCSSDEDGSLVDQKKPLSVMPLSKQSKSQLERDHEVYIQKPLSLLLSLSNSPATLLSSSSKSRFSPVRKILGPFTKSMSRRSPLSGSNDAINHSDDRLDNYQHEGRVTCDLEPPVSPAHLHGILKFRNKHRMPFFEFSVDSTQDVYVTEAGKVRNAVDSVYTFHSLRRGRNANASGRGLKDRYLELPSSTVGQMHASHRRCREFDSNGEESDSLVTEFVLHDILHSRKSSFSSSICSLDCNEVLEAELLPGLEIGAVITQVPFPESTGQRKTHAVIPAGSHASPATGTHGPSPLLDRWRSGGGCDCGGWDAACPLVVFTNENFTIDTWNLAELFVQGKKENKPAFAIRAIERGKYAVDFHAQLSSLQAFFICIAILHSTEGGSFRRAFDENKMKNAADEAMVEQLPSFVVNPPFSPVGRV